ncbi:MAG: hypothetical protein ACJ74U_18080 [Jatrophihabitantaceae bacterium]
MTGFAIRAPWYVRERHSFGLRDPRALRPEIQMYDSPRFVQRLLADPRDSVKPGDDDVWSYPVPSTPATSAKGRERFATSKLIHTRLRKLYQPSHDRFYALTVEVFCDEPGLPRAGSHTDLQVGMVMRRMNTTLKGQKGPTRRLARNLIIDMAKHQHGLHLAGPGDLDVRDFWWAETARRAFEANNAALLDLVEANTDDESWLVTPAGTGRWARLDAALEHEREQEIPMWRLPPRADDCAAAKTRSLWFGMIPTFSADHQPGPHGEPEPKLDDHALYELVCFVRQPPPRGHEHCPPKVWWSMPSEPFRLAAAFDPDGTKNHTVSITLPDLRRLAARSGAKPAGGVRITTPPNSQLPPIPFAGIPGGSGKVGAGGGTCSFALELFFIVAFFLFLLFLPIIVFSFQLWWMLALRFCFPPSISFQLLIDFYAAGHVTAQLGLPAFQAEHDALDDAVGLPGAGADLALGTPELAADPDPARTPALRDLVTAMDPTRAETKSDPPELEDKPDDPLCPAPAARVH